MIENMFVIFAPLTGGNHLANIISMSNRFNKRFDDSIYTQMDQFGAHPSIGKNYNPTESILRSLQHQSNIFCSHMTEYLMSKNLTEQHLHNRKYIMLEFAPHSRNKLFYQRTAKKACYQDSYFIEELSTLYSLDVFSKLTNETDLAKVDVDLLFSKDISKLLDLLNQEFGLIFDQSTVDTLHQLWLKKNKLY